MGFPAHQLLSTHIQPVRWYKHEEYPMGTNTHCQYPVRVSSSGVGPAQEVKTLRNNKFLKSNLLREEKSLKPVNICVGENKLKGREGFSIPRRTRSLLSIKTHLFQQRRISPVSTSRQIKYLGCQCKQMNI